MSNQALLPTRAVAKASGEWNRSRNLGSAGHVELSPASAYSLGASSLCDVFVITNTSQRGRDGANEADF